jgi:hypothetical protein
VDAALARGFDAALAGHATWWTGFWSRSSVRVPNAVVERQWYLDMYKWGSAARRGAPPITLQAVWTADNGRLPPWKGDYHHDLNTQLSYWPAYSGNHLEDGLSYLDWLWKTRDTAFEWTREFFEMPGLNVPMTADLNGRQIGGWRQYTHSATTSAWLAHHFYLHWRYSQDRSFLEQRAYPYLRDTAVFLEAFTANRDAAGKRAHPLSSSPEINDNKPSAWFDTATNYDLALDRWLFGKAAELAAELKLSDDEKRWRRVLARVAGTQLRRRRRIAGGAGTPAALLAPAFFAPDGHPSARPDQLGRGRRRAAHDPRVAGRASEERHGCVVRIQLLVAREPCGACARWGGSGTGARDLLDGVLPAQQLSRERRPIREGVFEVHVSPVYAWKGTSRYRRD